MSSNLKKSCTNSNNGLKKISAKGLLIFILLSQMAELLEQLECKDIIKYPELKPHLGILIN